LLQSLLVVLFLLLTNQKSPAMQMQLCDVGYGYVFTPKQLVNSEAN
jgi:hypothetical protein